MSIKVGSTVRVVQPVLEGEVLRMDTNGSEFGYQVRFTTPDGQTHERFFTVEQIEEVQP